MSTYRALLRLAALATAMIATGCQPGSPAPVLTPGPPRHPPTAAPTPTFTATEAAFDANRNPLSGLPSTHGDIAERRPSAAVIRLSPDAEGRPADLSGLQASELVFLVATKPAHLVAMTLDRPDERPSLGPLGEAWPIDLALARQFGATLRAASASTGTLAAQATAPVPLELLSAATPPPGAQPEGPPPRPNWTYSEERSELSTQLVQVLTVTLPVAPDAGPASGFTESEGVLSHFVWRYDPALTVYRLELNGQPVVDQSTGEGITAANLVFVMYPKVGDANAPEAFTGSADMAVISRDGHSEPADWERPDTTSPFRLLDGYKLAANLRPGNTWIVLSDTQRQIKWWPEREFDPTPTPQATPGS